MSSPPETYFVPEERTFWVDQHFAMLGRVLALATRYERSCKLLDILLNRNPSGASLLSSADSVKKTVETVWKRHLAAHVREISAAADGDVLLFDLVDKGRKARNSLVHESTLGFEHWNDESSFVEEQLSDLRQRAAAWARELAEADFVVCTNREQGYQRAHSLHHTR